MLRLLVVTVRVPLRFPLVVGTKAAAMAQLAPLARTDEDEQIAAPIDSCAKFELMFRPEKLSG